VVHEQDVTDVANDAVVVRQHGDVLRITLNRPSRRNAMSAAMAQTVVAALSTAAVDDSLRAVHLEGAGGDFCAGADWVSTNSGAHPRPRTGDLVRRIPHASHRVIDLITTIHLPVVCSVRGWAVGLGCNLALAADFTIAAADAVFWEPFVARGFSPDSGSSWLLPRLIGLARAKEMLLLGEQVRGSVAAEWGLIHRSVAPEDLHETTGELLARLAGGPTVAIALAKQALHYSQHATLSQALNQELYNVELSCRTADFKEGLAAFRDGRDPRFQGR
jgi:2-(1,2-epoxy-1,2-dihydrophenyl)acetyl-CoA isomerase